MDVRARARATRAAAVLGVLGLVTVGMVASPAAADDPCGPTGNAIVCENSKPGADPSEWDIVGAGDDGIQGFSTDISVDVGDTIGFKIDTDASAYTIDIYRTGWYGGLGARKIASVTPSATLPQHQPECVSDVTTELYDCGGWALSASWTVPTTAVSGVYVAHLKVPATGEESHITFVVRDDASTSDVIFQTSDPTWQAYNTYGGSDFYQGAANGRAYKISYNRPVVTRGLVQGRDFYFSSEYAMVRFLERNGYDVSYQSGVDTDRYGAHLLNHKVFLSVGHDEYWSGAQRANVEAARDAGVNLAFFSGNEVYWRTRYEPSAAGTATPYRTLVSYKETWSNDKIDPAAEWTGTWRDPRFASTANGGGLPENGLTGTAYMANDSDLAITVSADEGKLRLWRDTGLSSMAAGGSTSLAPHTVGYESDEDLDNGFRPAGLIRLSTTAGRVVSYLQDFGNVVLAGDTTHHLTMYRADSGALVFSAGTIQWAWGLDQEHDGYGAPADVRMQQATVNLLADMHVQPHSLMSGLTAATASTDVVPPVVQLVGPAAGTQVSNGTSLTVHGTATDVGGRVAGVEVSLDGGASWHPATGTSSWTYTGVVSGVGVVDVRVRAADDSANLGPEVSRSVTVSCPCSIYGAEVPSVPSVDDSTPLELGLTFTPQTSGFVTGIRFYKGPGNGGTHVGSLWTASGDRLSSVTFTDETESGWQTAQLVSAVPVVAGQHYVVSYTAPQGRYAADADAFWYAGRDASPLTVAGGFGATGAGIYGVPGQFPSSAWAASEYFVDVLFSTTDTTPFSVSSRWPLVDATTVSLGSLVTAQLSRAPDSDVTISVVDATGATVDGETRYDASTRTASFVAEVSFAPASRYTATVHATLGSTNVQSPTWSFTTSTAAQSPGASTVTLYDESDLPTVLQDSDTAAVTLGVRFSSTVDGFVSGVRFYKGPGNTGTHVGALWREGATNPLATATFQDESASGWQTVLFATPVHVTAGNWYVASYRTTVGRYSSRVGEFSGVGIQRPPLVTATDSGAFSYADAYPAARSSASYLVDPIFTREQAALVATALTPGDGETGIDVDSTITATFSLAVEDGAALSLSSDGDPVAATLSRSADGKTLQLRPSSPLARGTTYSARAAGLTASNGSSSDDVVWSFTTEGTAGCPCTLLGDRTPAVATTADSSRVELGVSFVPSVAGTVTAVRFYKGEGNTGTHTGSVWSASGQRLRTVTFTDETATGWQTAELALPLAVSAGQTYVVSYLAPNGGYSATPNAFDAAYTVGPLSVAAVGNGRFAYGGGFPVDTWQQTNYYVDVVFEPAAAAPPTVVGRTPAPGEGDVATSTHVVATLSASQATGEPTAEVQVGGTAVVGQSTYDPDARTLTFVPSAPLPAGTSVTVEVLLGDAPVEGGTWTFTTTSAAPAPEPASLWSDADVPQVASWDDPASVQVGTRFTTSVAGTVTAVRFYKGATNTGTHTVKLWGSGQALLAEAVSTNESASGWQTVPLPQPVAVEPGVTYVAAYHSTTGRYAVTSGGLASVRTVGPLSTVADGGAYVYGTGYPGSSSSTFYGVDLVFVPAG